jgi:hypothetical protein
MTVTRRNQLRKIMKTAWWFSRSEPARRFGDCLAGAWRFIRKLDGWVAKNARAWRSAGRISFAPLTESPIARRLRGDAYARSRGYQAAYTTAQVGR